MENRNLVTVNRDVPATEIPVGTPAIISQGTVVRIMQSLGNSYSVTSDRGYMYRIDASDADALGITPETKRQEAPAPAVFSEKLVWDQLRTVFDPEIPVNIVDLGLIYSCVIAPVIPDQPDSGQRIDIKMTMTAPGCGMGNILKADVENKLSGLPDVKQVDVEVVLEPVWSPQRMSEAAKLQLGFDLDVGSPDAEASTYGRRG